MTSEDLTPSGDIAMPCPECGAKLQVVYPLRERIMCMKCEYEAASLSEVEKDSQEKQ